MTTTSDTTAPREDARPNRVDLAGALLARLPPPEARADVLLHRSERADRPLEHLLLAIGGTSSPDSAIQTAAALAARHGASVEVLSVYEPRIPYPSAPSRESLRRLENDDRPAAEEQLARTLARIRNTPVIGEVADRWKLHLAIGQAAATIASIAYEQAADVIVMGRGHGAGDERWLYDRTALRVALLSAVPILAVVEPAERPSRLLIPTGLDALSLRVATAALRLFPDAAVVELLHVRNDERTTSDEVASHFRRVELALGAAASRVVRTVLDGNPLASVLAHIRTTRPDIVAVGLYGATVTERASDENVALHLIESGPSNLLVVPA